MINRCFRKCNQAHNSCVIFSFYLLKFGTSQNQPKPVETSRNGSKRAKTTSPKNSKQPKTTQNFKSGEIWNFLLAFVFQISSPNGQIWVFWIKKYQLSNLLTIFFLYPILKMLISNLTIFFKKFEPKCPNFEILGQKVSTF